VCSALSFAQVIRDLAGSAGTGRDRSCTAQVFQSCSHLSGRVAVIKPNREDATHSAYELASRLHIIPGIGRKRIDKLTYGKRKRGLTGFPATASASPRRKTPSEMNRDAARLAHAAAITRVAA
jgi:hypothetical protein